MDFKSVDVPRHWPATQTISPFALRCCRRNATSPDTPVVTSCTGQHDDPQGSRDDFRIANDAGGLALDQHLAEIEHDARSTTASRFPIEARPVNTVTPVALLCAPVPRRFCASIGVRPVSLHRAAAALFGGERAGTSRRRFPTESLAGRHVGAPGKAGKFSTAWALRRARLTVVRTNAPTMTLSITVMVSNFSRPGRCARCRAGNALPRQTR